MNKIYTHPGQPEMQVEVILASKGPDQAPLYTIRMRYPRIIHGEIMTHRVFSRNARSSRAVPVKTMLNEVRNTPFIPWHWGKNQKGMQADEECREPIKLGNLFGNVGIEPENAWLHFAHGAADHAEAMMNAGYHKQIPNRLLEPFSWIDTLITSCDWNNFLWLRDHKDAEPHLQDLARLVKQAIEEAEIQHLDQNEWHLPYITPMDIQNVLIRPSSEDEVIFNATKLTGGELLRCISAARCARISYKPFDGDASYEKELQRYDQLVSSDRVHASPTEHQATPDTQVSNLIDSVWKHSELHGNLPGWIQSRKLIPGENHSG